MIKYCFEDLPSLLKAENLDNVPILLSHLIGSLPANAGSFIKWVVEVRRTEEGGQCLSEEEKERLLVKVAFPFHFLLLDQKLLLPYIARLSLTCRKMYYSKYVVQGYS